MISNNKITNLVASQLPFYVRNDHQNFVAFLEAYYEFLEQQNGAVNVSRSLLDQQDIDQTDLFIQKFYDNFIPLLPNDILADRVLVTKKIKDFYRAKGSEKSIRFLLRILFNEDAEFYYPKTDVLRASDGKWFVEKSIKISDVKIDSVANNDPNATLNFINRKITGLTSNATAIVERVDIYYEEGSLVSEAKISNIYKSFGFGETIQATFLENGVEKTISANLFSGGLNTVEITNPGSSYNIGDTATIEGGNGAGAVVTVSAISEGDLTSIASLYGGAGYRIGDRLLFTSQVGSGANGNVIAVKADSSFHPNSYNICVSVISAEANTPIGNAVYSNLNSTNAISWIQNAYSFFTYANTGPIVDVLLINKGTNYRTRPTISAEANNRVRDLGILGRMEIISGGQGYNVGDPLLFINVNGGYGAGANGRVKSVNTSNGNTITGVEFTESKGHIIGGTGYEQGKLPTIQVSSSNAGAYGAHIVATAVLGFGERVVSVGSTEGSILSLRIDSRGSNYDVPPTINLKGIGDGTAEAVATIITGAFSYPGRYLNDDGHLSSYNFIQDRDYYQPYSYVVKVKQSLERYRKALKELVHPAGMKLFGEYSFIDNGETLNLNIRGLEDQISIGSIRNYDHDTGNVSINYNDHNLSVGNTVYVQWRTGNVANASAANSGPFKIKTIVDPSNFIISSSANSYISNISLPRAIGTANVFKIVV